MANESSTIVQRLWNYCNVLRDDGVSYGDYVEQLTYLLFLKMADEQTKPPFNKPSTIPPELDWKSLLSKDGDALEVHYRHILETLGKGKGMLGVIFRKSQNKIQDPAKLRRLIELINDETWVGLNIDVKGEIYEGLLQKNAEDIKSGQSGRHHPHEPEDPAQGPRMKGLIEDLILAEESRKGRDAGQRQRADIKSPVGDREVALEPPHLSEVLLTGHCMDHAAAAEEKKRLEGPVGKEMEDPGHIGPQAAGHHHGAELAHGRVGHDAFDVVLGQRNGRGKEGRRPPHHRDHIHRHG